MRNQLLLCVLQFLASSSHSLGLIPKTSMSRFGQFLKRNMAIFTYLVAKATSLSKTRVGCQVASVRCTCLSHCSLICLIIAAMLSSCAIWNTFSFVTLFRQVIFNMPLRQHIWKLFNLLVSCLGFSSVQDCTQDTILEHNHFGSSSNSVLVRHSTLWYQAC